jgi:Protein of unknown function (DUF2950)
VDVIGTDPAKRVALAAMALLLVSVGPPARGHAQPAAQPADAVGSSQAQRVFASPEAAVRALIEAIQAPGTEALAAILGRAVLDSVPPGERQAASVRRAAGARLAGRPFEIRYEDGARSRAVAVFGGENATLPAVLRRTARGWAFDQEGTIAAMRERRIGVNEANAIRALQALAQAQERFRVRDRTGDGVLQYAGRIRSTPGSRDGLVAGDGDAVPGASASLLNEAFARAEAPPGQRPPDPPGGYAYRILSAQGPNAEGGARSYGTNGRLTEGFAAVAWPTRPGVTGLSTFIMNQRGAILEREFGARTAEEVRQITAFDPGPGWLPVESDAPGRTATVR